MNNIANSKLDSFFLSKIEVNQTGLITDDTLQESSGLVIFVNFRDDINLNNLSDESRIVVSSNEISNLNRGSSFKNNWSSLGCMGVILVLRGVLVGSHFKLTLNSVYLLSYEIIFLMNLQYFFISFFVFVFQLEF